MGGCTSTPGHPAIRNGKSFANMATYSLFLTLMIHVDRMSSASRVYGSLQKGGEQ